MRRSQICTWIILIVPKFSESNTLGFGINSSNRDISLLMHPWWIGFSCTRSKFEPSKALQSTSWSLYSICFAFKTSNRDISLYNHPFQKPKVSWSSTLHTLQEAYSNSGNLLRLIRLARFRFKLSVSRAWIGLITVLPLIQLIFWSTNNFLWFLQVLNDF